MELNIQKLLRSTPNALDLIRSLGIRVSIHPEYPSLHQFTYGQIETHSRKDDPIVVESRGLILDQSSNWSSVAHPFHRFFNEGESGAATIDWSTARVQEKLDGSLIVMYWYADAWHVATKGTPAATAQVWAYPFTFRDLFWNTWNRQFGQSKLNLLIPGYTYCWEITSRYCTIVTRQTNNDGTLTLLAVRNADGVEEQADQWQDRFAAARQFNLQSAVECKLAADSLDPLDQEGFVVVDGQFNRVKIKGTEYVRYHHLKYGMGVRSLIELIQAGEADEALIYFPEVRSRYEQVLARMQEIGAEIDQLFSTVPQGLTRKETALYITSNIKSDFRSAMFALWLRQSATGFDWLMSQTVDHVKNRLGLLEELPNEEVQS